MLSKTSYANAQMRMQCPYLRPMTLGKDFGAARQLVLNTLTTPSRSMTLHMPLAKVSQGRSSTTTPRSFLPTSSLTRITKGSIVKHPHSAIGSAGGGHLSQYHFPAVTVHGLQEGAHVDRRGVLSGAVTAIMGAVWEAISHQARRIPRSTGIRRANDPAGGTSR